MTVERMMPDRKKNLEETFLIDPGAFRFLSKAILKVS